MYNYTIFVKLHPIDVKDKPGYKVKEKENISILQAFSINYKPLATWTSVRMISLAPLKWKTV